LDLSGLKSVFALVGCNQLLHKENILKLLKSALLASLIISLFPAQGASAEQTARPVTQYLTPPINPFDANGYCFHSGCPALYLGATVSTLTGNPRFPMYGTVPATIPFIYLGIDNDGYSNWWRADAFLVSSNGTRVALGRGESSDGNEYEDIGIRCQPQYDINPCTPSISWFNAQIPVTTPVGVYALEVRFSLYDGRTDAAYTFGPDFMTVTGQILPRTLDGKVCKVAGRKQNLDGVQYACLKKGKRLVWQRLF
jgi:hypothetical protein